MNIPVTRLADEEKSPLSFPIDVAVGIVLQVKTASSIWHFTRVGNTLADWMGEHWVMGWSIMRHSSDRQGLSLACSPYQIGLPFLVRQGEELRYRTPDALTPYSLHTGGVQELVILRQDGPKRRVF
jgi:hypothetical protein